MDPKSLLAEIKEELSSIQSAEREKLGDLWRKTEVLLKKLFGKESEYLERLYSIRFDPEGVIYNTGHYKNREAWENGIRLYNSLLESVKYELELNNIADIKQIDVPEKITLRWLINHVPMPIWFSFAGMLSASFLLGFGAYQGFLKYTGKQSIFSTNNTQIGISEVITNSNIPMFLLDNQANYIDCNKEFLSLVGLNRNAVIGNSIKKVINQVSTYIPEEQRASFLNEQEKLFNLSIEDKLPHADAYHSFDLRNSPNENYQGQFNAWIHVDKIFSKSGKALGEFGLIKLSKFKEEGN